MDDFRPKIDYNSRMLPVAPLAKPAFYPFETLQRVVSDVLPLRDDVAALNAYAAQNHLQLDDLVLFSDAWEFGGDEGLKALLHPDILPSRVARRTCTQIRNLLTVHFAARRDFRITDEGTAIGVYHIRYHNTGMAYLHPIAQLRATLPTRHWHLYARHNDLWWPIAPPVSGRYRFTLKTRVQQIIDDRGGRF